MQVERDRPGRGGRGGHSLLSEVEDVLTRSSFSAPSSSATPPSSGTQPASICGIGEPGLTVVHRRFVYLGIGVIAIVLA